MIRLIACTGLLLFASTAAAQKITSPDEARKQADFLIQGEYAGSYNSDGTEEKTGIQIIALGDGKFRAVGYEGGLPGAGWNKKDKHSAEASLKDGLVVFESDDGKAEVKDGVLTIFNTEGKKVGTCKRIERKSPTLGAKPPAGAVVLFDQSKPSLDKLNNGQLMDNGLLTPKGNIKSKDQFGSCLIHIEFMLPYMPKARGQGRGNSGCYIADAYECQILDSFGLEGKDNECGGFYQARDPDQNMCLPPLQWQTYDIDYTAPVFDSAGKKTKNAVITVKHNGVLIHEKFEIAKQTPGGKGESPTGAVHLQDHGNPVMFKSIWVVPKK